jgi:phosphatidylserine/phosphatidylglycerophosphate/cardiolipin synthase-like enzyme
MTKKSKTLKSPIWPTLLTILVLAIYFAYTLLSDPQPAQQPQPLPVTPQVQGAVTTSSKSFELYFTNPVRPFAGNTENSIEYRLIEKINDADSSLHGAFFEFDLQSVADALINAHNRGVDVSLIYDNEHTDSDPQMAEMIKAGIKAVPDERSAYMHNKFLVVDNQCVWTGSFNLTVNAAYKNNENAFYLCNQSLADNYQTEFSEMFTGEFGPSSPSNTPNPNISVGELNIQSYFAPEDNVSEKIVSAVSKSQTSIHFLAFSFTDDSVGQEMLNRQSNGVSVSGIFESRGANTDSSQCKTLLRSGADIHLDGNPYTLHEKVIIIDGKTVIFGSYNFSSNADKSNDENLLIIENPEFAQLFEKEFQARLAESISLSGKTCEAP